MKTAHPHDGVADSEKNLERGSKEEAFAAACNAANRIGKYDSQANKLRSKMRLYS